MVQTLTVVLDLKRLFDFWVEHDGKLTKEEKAYFGSSDLLLGSKAVAELLEAHGAPARPVNFPKRSKRPL
jgi:hypothetical protein